MSRRSNPKPAPAEAPTTEPQAAAPDAAAPDPAADAPQTAPETTGAASAPASAAAEEPAAPVATQQEAPKIADQHGPEGWVVKVTGPAKGRWRAGRKFGPEQVTIPASDLTEGECAQLKADPELIVVEVEETA